MPIRFRCAYCNQLMGIARRKAGTVVRCPTCAGQVVVPNTDAEEEPEGTARQPAPADPPLFERSDFDEVFDVPKQPAPRPLAAPSPSPAAPAGAWGTHAEPEFDMERVDAPRYQPPPDGRAVTAGIMLSPAKATLLTVLAIVALALAFGAGLLVGRYVIPPPPPQDAGHLPLPERVML